MKIDCTLHGQTDPVCSTCSFKKDDVIAQQRKVIENMEVQIKGLENYTEELKTALKPFQEDAIKADPMGAFATSGTIGMMQKEIESLEEKLRSAEDAGMRFRNAGVALLRAWVDKDYDAVLAMIAIGEVHR